MKHKFAFRKYKGADPDAIKAHLDGIAKKGLLTPKTVLADAVKKSSLLHPLFCWDDTLAAELYRERQARDLIAIIIRVDSRGEEELFTRAFVHVRIEDEPQYVSLSVAMNNVNLREQVLANALRELDSFERKYKHLSELAEVFAAARKARSKGSQPDIVATTHSAEARA